MHPGLSAAPGLQQLGATKLRGFLSFQRLSASLLLFQPLSHLLFQQPFVQCNGEGSPKSSTNKEYQSSFRVWSCTVVPRGGRGLFHADSSLSFSPWIKVQARFAHRQPAVPSAHPGAKADSSPGPAPCTCPQPFSRTESRRGTGEEEKEGKIGVEPSKAKSKVEAEDISARRNEGLLRRCFYYYFF